MRISAKSQTIQILLPPKSLITTGFEYRPSG